jgi:viologen exporter family transport system permease protein
VRVYLTAARLSFRRYITYRSATIAGVITNTCFAFIRAFILLAMWHEKPHIGNYDAADAVTYVFLTQGLIAPVGVFLGSSELGARIRTGEVATDLYRPCDLQFWFLATDLGRAGASLLLRAVPPVVVGALCFPTRLPAGPLRWLEFALCCLLALLISFAIRYLISLTAFWTMDERGTASLLLVVSMFFSGMIIPLVAMPGWLGALANVLPWSGTLQIPIDVLLGTDTGGFANALAFQLLWAAALFGVGRALTVAARHKTVVQGG